MNRMYYIRAKYIRTLCSKYPDIKENQIVKIELLEPDCRYAKFAVKAIIGLRDYLNPRSERKCWYVNYSDLMHHGFRSPQELLTYDKEEKEYKYFISIMYENRVKYTSNANRYIEVTVEEYNKYHIDDIVAISSLSNSKGYEKAKIIYLYKQEKDVVTNPTLLPKLDRQILGLYDEVDKGHEQFSMDSETRKNVNDAITTVLNNLKENAENCKINKLNKVVADQQVEIYDLKNKVSDLMKLNTSKMLTNEVAFNMNYNVRVTLTKAGANVLNRYHNLTEHHLFQFNKYSEGQIYEDQLWHLMYIFGSSMSLVSETVFKNNEIIFKTKNLKKVEEKNNEENYKFTFNY